MTQKELKKIFYYNEETGEFTWKVRSMRRIRSGDVAGTPMPNGYVAIGIKRKKYLAHRLAWLYIYGKFPENQIDHLNHKRNDNRICNLRDVTHKENHKNYRMRANNTSGVSGVYWHKLSQKWLAQIQIGGNKVKNLGTFVDINDAKEARERAKIKYGFHPNHA